MYYNLFLHFNSEITKSILELSLNTFTSIGIMTSLNILGVRKYDRSNISNTNNRN